MSAQKNVAEHVQTQADFLKAELEPRLAEARAGQRQVFFGDAAHFVLGTYLCWLWTKTRRFVKAAAGRQRYNVLGAWNAVTNTLLAVTNTTVVNAETACELPRVIAAQSLGVPVTLVLDNARYQYCQRVRDVAEQLGIELLFLPPYSPNLNLIERLWKFVKNKALRGRYHATFAEFRTAIDDCLSQVDSKLRPDLKTLMTHGRNKGTFCFL
jgi:transposase